MKKSSILITLVLCLVSTVAQARNKSFSLDRLQVAIFGVSTLKGAKEVYPQIQIEIIKENASELSSTSKIESLARKDLEEQVVQALKKADIKIAENYDMTSADSPLSLNITVFIKVTNAGSPVYNTFIYTEAIQTVTLSRDNSIRSLSRTWPMMPMGLHNRNMFVLNPQTLKKMVKDEIARQVSLFISDFLAANPKPIERSAAGVDIDALRKTLLEENPKTRYGLRIRDDDPRLQVIKQLDLAGSEEAVNVLLEFLTNNIMDRKLKQHALTTLGRIGTEPAIEAVQKFEEWSKKRYLEPRPFQMSLQEHAIDHFAPSNANPIAQTIDANNKTWALVPLSRYGWYDLWLTSLNEKDQWSAPIFIDFPDFSKLQNTPGIKWNLTVKDNSVRIESDKIYEYKISDLLEDSDKDGLPDTVESRFLTDPDNPDSDGDGSPDGKDSNPLTTKLKQTDDITEIRQAVFAALFATSNSQNAIVIVDRDDFAQQEYYGFGGVVLRAPQSRDGFVNVTSIDIRYQSDDAATIDISDWEGPEAASTHEAKLEKINGKWVVVEFKMTMIS
ncbi:MAG: HEAT repeat domain-containing protein [Sedimentisphaerales bacterium]|nr:HEAT repeat domain-containing protein [Sedimentisphaerales bacterium]